MSYQTDSSRAHICPSSSLCHTEWFYKHGKPMYICWRRRKACARVWEPPDTSRIRNHRLFSHPIFPRKGRMRDLFQSPKVEEEEGVIQRRLWLSSKWWEFLQSLLDKIRWRHRWTFSLDYHWISKRGLVVVWKYFEAQNPGCIGGDRRHIQETRRVMWAVGQTKTAYMIVVSPRQTR